MLGDSIIAATIALLTIAVVWFVRFPVVRRIVRHARRSMPPAQLGGRGNGSSDWERSAKRINEEISELRRLRIEREEVIRVVTILSLQSSLLGRIARSLHSRRPRPSVLGRAVERGIDFVIGTLAGLLAAAVFQLLAGR